MCRLLSVDNINPTSEFRGRVYTLWLSFGDIIVANLKRNIKDKYIYCKKCGVLFKQNSNKHKYCSKCARDIKMEQTRDIARESMRKLRKHRNVKKIENPPNPHE